MKNKKIILILLALIMLTSCSLPGLGKGVQSDGIIVAGGSTSERQIMSEIVAQMINHYLSEGKPQLINNLGSSVLILQAIERDDANISGAMYTGTSLTGELGLEATTDRELAMTNVVKGYDDKFDMVWFPSYGFENTYAFMTSRKFAEENGITKISDLEKVKDSVRVGIDTGWLDRQGDGYDEFQKLYGFSFDTIRPMEIGLVYDAINNKNMDLALGYSTDGRINAYDLVTLEDDLHLFPPYDVSPVVTKKILRRYPEIEKILLKLENEISSEMMQKLNRTADEDKIEPTIVAKMFLEENNYFEDKEVVPLKDRELYKDIIKDILPIQGGK
ncbi:MAG: osmoprotectant ABC transporter substrate-binding protein [Tissierellia bacterium]|nr:osmoprotectant ABC transporter substrate-binding protein [Tissierellia bacterium]